MKEFEQVMYILRGREGFTHTEYDDLMQIFARFDRDSSGEVDTKEIISILAWLGYAGWNQRRVHTIVREVDVDGTGAINTREFLMVMRKVREYELKIIEDAMGKGDLDRSGNVTFAELEDVVQALGYAVAMESVREAVLDAGLDPEDGDFDLSEIWRLMQIYRAREGLGTEAINDINTAFARFDRSTTGEIDTLDVGKVLRWLGHPTEFEHQQQLIARVDVDGSGRIDLGEFKKMIRMYQESEIEQIRDAFDDADTVEAGKISRNQAIWALRRLEIDCEDVGFENEDMLPHADPNGLCMNFQGFVRVAHRGLAAKRVLFRSNGGFSQADVAEFRNQFERYDKDKSGDIANQELISLLECYFPEMATDPFFRTQLVDMLKVVDQDGGGTLDFQDFLQIMRELREQMDVDRVAKEQLAIFDCKFTLQEVSDFRELFISVDVVGAGSISLDDIRRLLETICPLGAKNDGELTSDFNLVKAKKKRPLTKPDQIDFPEFLWLMKSLLDTNFAQIRERTSTAHQHHTHSGGN